MKRALSPYGAMGSGVIHVLRVILQVAMAAVLARILGPKGYGTYAFALAFVSIIQTPVQSGMQNTAIRFTSIYSDSKDWSLLRGLWQRLSGWTCIYAVLAAGGWVLLAIFLGNGPGHIGSRSVFLAAGCVLLLIPFPALYGGMICGLGRPVIGQIPQFILYPGGILLFVFLVTVFRQHLTPSFAMILNAGACLSAAVVALFWIRSWMPTEVQRSTAKTCRRIWIRALVPLAFSGGVAVINNQASILMLGWMSNADGVGVFRAAFQGAALVSLSLVAVNMLIAPEIARLYVRGDRLVLQRVLTKGARFALIGAAPVFLFFIFLGHWVLGLVFGNAFIVGYPILITLSAGQFANVAAGPVGYILNMSGHERDVLTGLFISAISIVILNFILIPHFGIIGAAYANLVSMLIWNAFLIVRTRQRTGLDSSIIGFRSIASQTL